MKHSNLKGLVGESWIWPLGKAFDRFVSDIMPVLNAKSDKKIFPRPHLIFRAFKEVPFDQVKVIILAQDPYHDLGSATGLCFDNPRSQSASPSLSNILKEIEADTGKPSQAFENTGSYLEHLPSQGVLLLNSALTVEEGSPSSHSKLWEPFTQEAIQQIDSRLPNNVVWVLWGKKAQKYRKFIKSSKVIEGAHPSPFSYKAFKGNKFFTRINSLLTTPITW